MEAERKLVTIDWAMKKLLRHKANFGILEGLLSELLGKDVKIKEILEGESNQEELKDKFNRVDILATLDGEELVIIEVQNTLGRRLLSADVVWGVQNGYRAYRLGKGIQIHQKGHFREHCLF